MNREPDAWLVECPPRCEFDAMVFPDKQEAINQIDTYIDDTDAEGWNLFPLFRGKPEWIER